MLIESPVDPRTVLFIDPTWGAARASQRPYDYQVGANKGGHYSLAQSTGLVTVLNAGDAMFSMFWNSTERTIVLNKIKVSAVITTGFTTAQEVSVNLVRVQNMTAADTAGTAITVGGSVRKDTSAMLASVMADMRISTTVALTKATGAEEANSLAVAVLPIGNAVGSSASADLITVSPGAEHPYILEKFQGFRIRVHFTQGAAGVVRFTFGIDWTEIPGLFAAAL